MFNDHHCISNGHTFGYPPFVASCGIHFEVSKVAAALQQVCESASEIRPWNGAVPRPWSKAWHDSWWGPSRKNLQNPIVYHFRYQHISVQEEPSKLKSFSRIWCSKGHPELPLPIESTYPSSIICVVVPCLRSWKFGQCVPPQQWHFTCSEVFGCQSRDSSQFGACGLQIGQWLGFFLWHF